MLDVFQTDRFKQSLNSISRTTEKLASIMKNDARLRARDYQRISENNRRLRRVIPIIPGVLGTAGYIFGLPEPSGGFFGLPKFGTDPDKGFQFPPRPPKPPKGPKGLDPQEQLQEQLQEQEQGQTQKVPEGKPVRIPVLPFPGAQEQEDPRSEEANRRRQEQAKALAEAERERRRLLGEQEGQTGTPALEPVLISEKLKEIYGEKYPEVFEEGPVEIPQIVPTEKPVKQPKRELPPPLRLIQSVLNALKLNELAGGTTRLVLGQDGSQEKIREILKLSLNDQEVAQKIVQTFGLSTQLIPIIRLAYNLIPVGPSKYKRLFTITRFLANSVRQGKITPARIKELRADVERYVRTGSFFKGVPDAQRLQSAGMIRAQGARGPAGGYTNPLTGGPSQNIFGQTQFARQIQGVLKDRFPRIKPLQGVDPTKVFQGNNIVPFDIRNQGTLIKPPARFLEKIRTQGGGFFNRNPIRKQGETQLQPSDIKSQIERSGGFQDSDGNFYIFSAPKGSGSPPGPQASAETLIQPIIVFRDPPTA